MAAYEASNRVSWDSFRTKCLIVQYKKYDHLYNPHHELYRNKRTREETLGCIAKTLNTVWHGTGITCTVDDIKKKLNGLRSQYLFERQKIARAAAQGEVYVPTIYWYSMLKFLEPVTLTGRTATDASASEFVSAQMPAAEPEQRQLNIKIEQDESDSASNGGSPSTASSTSTQETFIDVQSYLQTTPTKRRAEDDPLSAGEPKQVRKQHQHQHHHHSAAACSSTTNGKPQQRLSRSEFTDHLETFGKFVVNELRGIHLSSNDIFLRRTKRQLQQVLIDAWTRIDMDESRYPGSTCN